MCEAWRGRITAVCTHSGPGEEEALQADPYSCGSLWERLQVQWQSDPLVCHLIATLLKHNRGDASIQPAWPNELYQLVGCLARDSGYLVLMSAAFAAVLCTTYIADSSSGRIAVCKTMQLSSDSGNTGRHASFTFQSYAKLHLACASLLSMPLQYTEAAGKNSQISFRRHNAKCRAPLSSLMLPRAVSRTILHLPKHYPKP